jgi:hypothetical protein
MIADYERLGEGLSSSGAADDADVKPTWDEIAALDLAVGGDIEDVDTVSRCFDELRSATCSTGSRPDESAVISTCIERLQRQRYKLLARSMCIPPYPILQHDRQNRASESTQGTVSPLCEIERSRSELFDQAELASALLLWKGLLMLTVDPPMVTLGLRRETDGRTLRGILEVRLSSPRCYGRWQLHQPPLLQSLLSGRYGIEIARSSFMFCIGACARDMPCATVQELDEQLAMAVIGALVVSGHVDIVAATGGSMCVPWDDDVSRRTELVLSERSL